MDKIKNIEPNEVKKEINSKVKALKEELNELDKETALENVKKKSKEQPFNKNHLRPCPMLENPGILRKLVKKTHAIRQI